MRNWNLVPQIEFKESKLVQVPSTHIPRHPIVDAALSNSPVNGIHHRRVTDVEFEIIRWLDDGGAVHVTED